MYDDQRKQQVLAAEETIRRLAGEMQNQADRGVRIEAAARALEGARTELAESTLAVRHCLGQLVELKRATDATAAAAVKRADALEDKLLKAIEDGNGRIGGVGSSLSTGFSDLSSQAQVMREAIAEQSLQSASLENTLADLRADMEEARRSGNIAARRSAIAVSLGVLNLLIFLALIVIAYLK